MKRMLVCLVLVVASLNIKAHAHTLYYWVHGKCPDGYLSTEMGIVDDATGMSYVIVRGCGGTVCIYPLYGPFQYSFNPSSTPPPRWWTPLAEEVWEQNVDEAHQITTPGAYVGIWLLTENNDTLRFRNPINQAEHNQYMAMWEHEQGQSMMVSVDGRNGSLKLSQGQMNDLLVASMEEDFRRSQKNNTGQQASRSLIDRYWQFHFGDRFPDKTELQAVADITSKLALTGQVLICKQTPSPTNGQTMIVSVIDPAFAGYTKVLDASGKTMWEGNVDGPTYITLNYPSGTYFVQGDGGKPIVVNIVH